MDKRLHKDFAGQLPRLLYMCHQIDWPLQNTSIWSQDCFCCIFEMITELCSKKFTHNVWGPRERNILHDVWPEWGQSIPRSLIGWKLLVITMEQKENAATSWKEKNKKLPAGKLELRYPYQRQELYDFNTYIFCSFWWQIWFFFFFTWSIILLSTFY